MYRNHCSAVTRNNMARSKRSSKRYGKGKGSKRRRGPAKRRPRKRAKRGGFGKENRMMAIPSATFTPTTCIKKFVYDLTIDLVPTANGGGFGSNQFCQFVFTGNNINNPFVGAFLHPSVTPTYQGKNGSTPTGDQVAGFTRWIGGSSGQNQAQAPYAKYVVIGSKCSATISQTTKVQNTAGIGAQQNVCPYILSTPPSAQAPSSNYWGVSETIPTINVDHLRTVRGAKITNLVNVNGLTANAQQSRLTMTQSPKTVLGVKDLQDDNDAIGTLAGGPTKTTLFRVGIANRVYDDASVHGMSGVLIRVRMEYKTKLYAPTAWTLNYKA